MELYYRNEEVTPDLYCLEWLEYDKNIHDEKVMYDVYQFFRGRFAYQEALIYAYKENITGSIVYCLSLQSQRIEKGLPVKRGRKKKTQIEKLKKQNLTPEIIRPPKNLVQII